MVPQTGHALLLLITAGMPPSPSAFPLAPMLADSGSRGSTCAVRAAAAGTCVFSHEVVPADSTLQSFHVTSGDHPPLMLIQRNSSAVFRNCDFRDIINREINGGAIAVTTISEFTASTVMIQGGNFDSVPDPFFSDRSFGGLFYTDIPFRLRVYNIQRNETAPANYIKDAGNGTGTPFLRMQDRPSPPVVRQAKMRPCISLPLIVCCDPRHSLARARRFASPHWQFNPWQFPLIVVMLLQFRQGPHVHIARNLSVRHSSGWTTRWTHVIVWFCASSPVDLCRSSASGASIFRAVLLLGCSQLDMRR